MERTRRWLRRTARCVIFTIAALVVVAVALVWSMRFAFVQQHIGEVITALAQRRGHFFVRVGNVRGNPPWNVQVDRVEIGDAYGVWMVIEDGEADWHPFELWQPLDHTHLRINVDRVHARRLLWTRLPIDAEPDGKPFRWDKFPRILVGDLVVDEFELTEGLLAGGHAVLRAHGNGILGEWEHGRLDLTLEHIDDNHGGAKIDLYSDGSPPSFHGSVVADEDAGGALAFLARLPGAGPVQLRAESSGPLGDWSATADVSAGAIGKLQTKAHIAFGPSGAFRFTGSFEPVAVQRDRYLVGPGAPLLLALDGAWIPDRELRLERARLDGDGRVLEVHGHLDLGAVARPYELAATLSRAAAVGAQGSDVELGALRLAAARLDAKGMLGAKRAATAAPGGAADGGAAPGAVAEVNSGATIGATLEVDDLAAGDFEFGKLRGALDGEQRGGEGPLLFNLDLRGEEFTSRDAPVPLVGKAPWLKGSGEAVVAAGVVSFRRLEFGGDAVGMDGSLDINDDWKGLRTSLAAHSDDLAGLSASVGSALSGGADLKLELDSKARGEVLQARIEGKAFGLSFADPGLQALLGPQLTVTAGAAGKFRGEGKADVSVVAAGISADAHAEMQDDGRTIAATFTSALDNLARLSDRAAVSLAGRLEASGELHGVLGDFSLRAQARAGNVVYGGARFDMLTADVSASGLPQGADAQFHVGADYGDLHSQFSAVATMPDSATVVLHDVVVEGPATKASADLRVGLDDGSVSGTVNVVCEDLSRWRGFVAHGIGGRLAADIAITPSIPGGTGRSRLSGKASLSDGSIVLQNGEAIVVKSLSAAAQALAVGGEPSGEVSADVAGARVDGVTLEKAKLGIQGDGKRWIVSTSAAGSAAAAWTLAARGALTPKPVRDVAQQPSVGARGFSASVDLFDMTLGSDAVRLQAPTVVEWTADSVEVASTTIGLGESGKLSFAGKFGADGARADARLDAAPLSIVSFLVSDLGLRGSVGGSLSLRGSSLVDSVADLHLEGKELASRSLEDSGVAALDAVADAHLERRRLRAEAALGGLGKERFHLKVDAPIGAGARDNDSVSASMLWHGDLADLAALAPLGEDVLKGAVSADLRLGGSVAAPLLSGDLFLSGGSYENAVSGLVLRDLELKVVAQGSNLVLEKLSATDGEKGRITATGRAALARLPAFDADMQLHADAATLARLEQVTATADADLTLHLGRARDAESVEGSVLGKVGIVEARIRVADHVAAAIPELSVVEINDVVRGGDWQRERGPAPVLWNVVLDVVVKGNNRVYVEGRGLESEWSTDLHVGGTAADPRVTGLVRSVRGRLGLLGKRFDVTSADLRFDGSPSGIPYLTLTAQAQANDITAIVVANGPATTPNIELRSDPALPSDDVLSRLLFGKGATNLTPVQSVQVAQSLAELTGLSLGGAPGLIDKLGRTLGLDRLGVEAGSGNNAGSALTASKYITDKVYLRVQQGLTPQDSKVSVEWEVFKRLRIESDVSQDAQGEVGASWQWDY